MTICTPLLFNILSKQTRIKCQFSVNDGGNIQNNERLLYPRSYDKAIQIANLCLIVHYLQLMYALITSVIIINSTCNIFSQVSLKH